MAETGFRTAVVVAIIGLIGTIGAAVVANWDKLSGANPGTPKAVEAGTSASATHEVVEPGVAASTSFVGANPGTTKAIEAGTPVSATHVVEPDVPASTSHEAPTQVDAFRVTSIYPPLSTVLTGDAGDVTISIHYELYSADSATLNVRAAWYEPGPGACAGPGLTGGGMGSSNVFISHGSGDRTMTVRSLSAALAAAGYLGLSASLSVGVPGTPSYRKLTDLPEFHEYCYRVAGNQ